ncbi:MAG: hypothetical protein GX341_07090 [Firmicutes bacterium]|nr:hypothetical protein [Bacillota bacterium]
MKANVQARDERTNPVILVIIVVCLLYAIFNSLSIFALGLFGETTVGTLTSYSNRIDDSRAPSNESRTVTKGYRFSVGGIEYKGHSTYRSDEAWPNLKEGERRMELISYLPFFPRVNKPTHLVDFSELGVAGVFHYSVAILGAVGLFWLLRREIWRKKPRNGE